MNYKLLFCINYQIYKFRKSFYRNKIIIELVKNLTKILSRSIINCSVQDLIDGKIPDEFLRGRNLYFHFIFILKRTKELLIPSDVIDVFLQNRTATQITFYDPIDIVKTNKITLKKGEQMYHKKYQIKTFKAIEFNRAFNRGDIIEPYFINVINFDVLDSSEDILVYFLDPHDYKEYEKYLKYTAIV